MRNRPYGTPKGRPSFEDACQMYVHRFTVDHVPMWAQRETGSPGRFYAPHFASDREWYDNTLFPGEECHSALGARDSCFTTGQTWPYGQWLDEPYRKDDRPPPIVGPRIGVTGECNGSSEGHLVIGIEAAARWAAEWIRGIDPEDVGVDFRVSLEILEDDGE